MIALVLTLCFLLGYRTPPMRIVHAIADAAQTAEDAALLVVYGVHESGLSEHPRAWSWDARAGVSCGPWQLRCTLSSTPEADARTWLANVRRAGLAAVDSSSTRAEARRKEAIALLARSCPMGEE
jgi:hypothetical protein